MATAITQLPTPTPTPTTPLPPAAAAALAKLECTSIAPAVVRAVTEYETAALHAVELSDLALIDAMSDVDAHSLLDALDLMAAARKALAKAGHLDLIEAA
jgi:hypothetical protein